jgi:hypothetical protein
VARPSDCASAPHRIDSYLNRVSPAS